MWFYKDKLAINSRSASIWAGSNFELLNISPKIKKIPKNWIAYLIYVFLTDSVKEVVSLETLTLKFPPSNESSFSIYSRDL